MSADVGFVSPISSLRATAAAQNPLGGLAAGAPKPIAAFHGRELRAHVEEALRNGERYLVVDCEGWSEPSVGRLSALLHCAHRSRELGAVLELSNLSVDVRSSMRDLGLEKRLGLS
jgi:hypothetical protein